jgi:hypothetical protein
MEAVILWKDEQMFRNLSPVQKGFTEKVPFFIEVLSRVCIELM